MTCLAGDAGETTVGVSLKLSMSRLQVDPIVPHVTLGCRQLTGLVITLPLPESGMHTAVFLGCFELAPGASLHELFRERWLHLTLVLPLNRNGTRVSVANNTISPCLASSILEWGQ